MESTGRVESQSLRGKDQMVADVAGEDGVVRERLLKDRGNPARVERSILERPMVGRRDIALNWDSSPALEVETLSVTFHRFDEVPEDFALAEGENDSLEGWRRDHRVYFERTGGWAPDMMLMCERFRVTKDFAEEGR